MQIETIDFIGRWSFYLGILTIISIMAHGVLLLVFHFMMPKSVLDKYFKPPYFKDMECLLFTGIPYAPIRTIMFMRVIAFPNSGKVRGITKAHLLVPLWFRSISKIMIIAAVTNMMAVMVFLLGLGFSYLFQLST